MPRAHIHIYVFVRFCVHILMCSHINTSTHSHIYIQICFYVLIQVCSYAFITIWKYDRITLYSYIDMHYDSSCFLSRCVTSSQKNVLQNRSAFRGALVQIARCVYVTRTRGNNAIIQAQLTWRNVLQFGASCFYICATQWYHILLYEMWYIKLIISSWWRIIYCIFNLYVKRITFVEMRL